MLTPPSRGDDWLALTDERLPVGAAHDWVVRPACGAVALFSGTVRDHAEHRTGVERLEYEAYDEQVLPRLGEIAAEMRRRWPVGRLAILHRVGSLDLGEVSVIVAASTPHRVDAFDAARFGIDTLKATVPIWKREIWDGGEDWGLAATELQDVADVAAALGSTDDGR